ncbi:MAG: ATP-binding protein [Elusimicrobia bacterium]|nr:ATP-binding protein [Elusimicrobiota bacterium]
MSESAYLQQQTEKFKIQFPASEGWNIFKSENRLLFIVSELIRKYPSALKNSELIKAVYYDTNFPENKYAPEFKIHSKCWTGDFNLEWAGEQLAIRSLCYENRGSSPYFLIAAKTWKVLENFYKIIFKLETQQAKNDYRNNILTPSGGKIPMPCVSWDDVILPDMMAEDLKAGVETFFKSKAIYKQFGLPYKRGFIFSGPAGCGKTLTAKVILSTLHLPSHLLTASSDRDRTSCDIAYTFSAAACHAPAVILIEELEKLSDPAYISQVLNHMDGLVTMRGVLVIATTNYPEKIDPALILRPSRFDRVWNFPLPDYAARLKLLKKKANGYFAGSVLETLAKQSGGFSMAYVQEIFASATSLAIRENRQVADKDMLKSVEILKKQIKSAPRSAAEVGNSSQHLGFVQV